MKLIVTGSRDYPDRHHVYAALKMFTFNAKRVDIIQGECPTGADAFTREWAREIGPKYPWLSSVGLKGYDADWNTYGRAAGPIRNEVMVDENLDADYVLAFPLGTEWSGTRHCMKVAREAGLIVVNLGEA